MMELWGTLFEYVVQPEGWGLANQSAQQLIATSFLLSRLKCSEAPCTKHSLQLRYHTGEAKAILRSLDFMH